MADTLLTDYALRTLTHVLGHDVSNLVGRATTTGTGNVVLSDTPSMSGTIQGTLGFAGVISFVNSTSASSPTTGAVVVTGGLGVGGAIYAAGQLQTEVLSSVAPTVFANQNGGYTVTVANGANEAITAAGVGGYFLIFVSEASSSGNMALYMIANAGATSILIQSNGNWEASTTTPAAGKFSVGWQGTRWAIYNNFGSSLSFKTFVFGM